MATFPQLEGVEHRTVQLPGLRMHVAEAGQGEPVLLLLHGFPQTWWEWRHVDAVLAEAADGDVAAVVPVRDRDPRPRALAAAPGRGRAARGCAGRDQASTR